MSAAAESRRSPRRAWIRALERTAAIGSDPSCTLPVLIDSLAERFGEACALAGRNSTLSYRAFAALCRRYSRLALARGLAAGDVIALLMRNRPEYLAIWLGLTRTGVTVALLNPELRGESLTHCIGIVKPRLLICEAPLWGAVCEVRARLGAGVEIALFGPGESQLTRIDLEAGALAGDPLIESRHRAPTLSDRALYIYTSGTTGLPKAANVSHRRLMQWSHWFSGLMDVTPDDRMYDCLPLHHSIGGVVAPGATLTAGGALVLRERFSAGTFWPDVTEARCTLLQYIGELCRYLVNHRQMPEERQHCLRLACGSGLAGDVWSAFKERFRIPQILEFYASTEGNVSLYNCEGRHGAIGRIPPVLAHRAPVALVRHDDETGEPLRSADGRCIRAARGETGEALGEIVAGSELTRFEGYADAAASRAKVLHDVFRAGDAWYRTGDLMRCDEAGFFYFVARVGDTFRWKGENVSAREIAGVLAAVQGVHDAVVYGVTVPHADGRAGMAALVVDATFDRAQLRRHLGAELPPHARPLFLRIVGAIPRTETLRPRTAELVREGYDPARIADPLYLDDAVRAEYVPLDASLYARLHSGSLPR